ncbi:hypothetical protein ACVI1J_010290 [Bradyrhizobium diazoefficiens]
MRSKTPTSSTDTSGTQRTHRSPPVPDLSKGLEGTLADLRLIAMRCRLGAGLGSDVSFASDDARKLASHLETLADIYEASKTPEPPRSAAAAKSLRRRG